MMILNQNRQYIRTKSLNWIGVEVKDILNYIHLRHISLSRQAVNTHLNKLVAEGEIKKSRKGREDKTKGEKK